MIKQSLTKENITKTITNAIGLIIFVIYLNIPKNYASIKRNFSLTKDGICIDAIIGLFYVFSLLWWIFMYRSSHHTLKNDVEKQIEELGMYLSIFFLLKFVIVFFVQNLSNITKTEIAGAHLIACCFLLLLFDLSSYLQNTKIRNPLLLICLWEIIFFFVYLTSPSIQTIKIYFWFLIGLDILILILLFIRYLNIDLGINEVDSSIQGNKLMVLMVLVGSILVNFHLIVLMLFSENLNFYPKI